MTVSVRSRLLAVVAAAALLLGLAVPAQAVPGPDESPSSSTVEELDPDPLPPAVDEEVELGESVPGNPDAPVEPVPAPPESAPAPGAPDFPEAAVAALPVTEVPPAEEEQPDSPRADESEDAPFPVAVWVPPPGNDGVGDAPSSAGAASQPSEGTPNAESDSAQVPTAVTVQVFDPAEVASLGGIGLAFTVARSDGVAVPGPVSVDASYNDFRFAAGGNLASRLGLVAVPACALTTPTVVSCRQRTPVPAVNHLDSGLLRAVVTAAPDPAGATASEEGRGLEVTDVSPGEIFVVESTAESALGDYAASPISPTGQWAVGIGSGDFTWSEALPAVPLPQGGTGSGPALSYSSASVDGRTTAKNPQASWAGIGWEAQTGSIDQAFQSCEDAGFPAGGTDSCVYDGVGRYTITLNGQTSALVAVAGVPNAFRLRDDPGWQVGYDPVRASWSVLTPDGTTSYFGYTTSSNSKWTVPVNDGSGTYQDLPWRWALSHVRDTSNNMSTYYYATETNFFHAVGGNKSYVRAGRLARVEFGRVFDDSEAANLETGALDFAAQYRCNLAGGACPTPPSDATAAQFPDVPVDLLCSGGATACVEDAPTFFTDYRLASVTSSVKSGSALELVDRVTLVHTLPDAWPDDDAGAQLWLSSVQTVGLDGASADVALPPTTFAGVPLNSRADAVESYAFRLHGVYLPTGGSIGVVYAQPTPCPEDPADLVGVAAAGDWDCFVALGERDTGDPGYVWYRKWLVTSVVTTPNVGGQDPPVSQATGYEYVDEPQVHHDSYAISDDALTFSIYRGYDQVNVTSGTSIDVYKVLRGMHRDRDVREPGEVTTVTVTDAHLNTYQDWDWYRSRVYEHARYSGSTLVEVSTSEPGWAPRSTPVDDPEDAASSRMVVDFRSMATVDVPAGTDRTTKSEHTYDTDGLLSKTVEYGDIATAAAGDDRCTTTGYVKNPTAWVLVPAETVLRPGLTCADPSPVLARTRVLYDGLAYGTAPVRGLPTAVREYSAASTFSSTQTSYDAQGRPTAVTDPNGNTTTTTYDPADPTVGLPNETTVTNELGHVTATTLHPRRRVPLATTDPTGHVTTAAYDALGRLAKVWRPTEPTGGPASMEYLYDLSATREAPPKVTTRVLQTASGGGTYIPTYEFFDGLGRARETQVVAPTGDGRIVTSTRYDDRGLVAAQTAPMHMGGAPGSAMGNPALAGIPAETRTSYDALQRPLTTTTYSDGVALPGMDTQTAYHGTSTTVTPAAGMPVTTHVDAYGRAVTVVEQFTTQTVPPTVTPWETDYTHDPLDNVTTITDHLGNVTTYTYDMLSRRTGSDDPDTGAWAYTYDPAGNTKKTTDAAGAATFAVYDELNRQTQQRKTNATGALLASWTYDTGARKGLLVASTSSVDGWDYTTNNLTYDARDRLTAKTYVIPAAPAAAGLDGSYTFGYGYDAADHRTAMTYPAAGGLAAETVTTQYSARGYEVSTAGTHTYIAGTSYKNFGLLARRDHGGTGNLKHRFSYQAGTRWLDNLTTDFDGATPQDSAYAHDLVGNVTEIVTTAIVNGAPPRTEPRTECFAYDNANRLTQATTHSGVDCAGTIGGTNGYDQTLGYDPIGRITTRSAIGAPADEFDTYEYSSTGHAVQEILHHAGRPPGGPPATATYDYDANGNRTASATHLLDPDPVETGYTWDERHLLVQTSVTQGATTETSAYVYDADATRLVRDAGDDATLYLDNTEIRPTGAAETSVRYYTTGQGVMVGLRAAGQPWTRVLLNHQGSTQYLIQNNTTTFHNVEYQPYGKTLTSTDALPTDRRYLHAPNDDQTGLIQLGARYYDPDLAQFISPDPVLFPDRPQTLNGYSYALNNPTTHTDPTGLAVDPGVGGGGWVPPIPPDAPGAPEFEGQLPDDPGAYGTEWVDAATDYAIDYDINDRFSWTLADHLAVSLNACDANRTVCGEDFMHYVFNFSTWAEGNQYAFGLAGAFAMRDQLPVELKVGSEALVDVSVYVGKNVKGQITYVGITNNFVRRSAEHGTSKGELTKVAGPVTRGEARAIEEALMVRAGGPKSPPGEIFLNQRHSISTTKKYYPAALSWGFAYLAANDTQF